MSCMTSWKTMRLLTWQTGKDISTQRDKACQCYGLKLAQSDLLDTLLQAVVATPLSAGGPSFC